MASMTDALELELLDGFLGVTQYTSPATAYLALFTADPTDTGSVANEVSGGSYARVALTSKFTAASGTTGASSNTAIITFPTATAAWGTITHVAIMKSGTATTADMMLSGALDDSVVVGDTDIFEYAIGDFTLTLA